MPATILFLQRIMVMWLLPTFRPRHNSRYCMGTRIPYFLSCRQLVLPEQLSIGSLIRSRRWCRETKAWRMYAAGHHLRWCPRWPEWQRIAQRQSECTAAAAICAVVFCQVMQRCHPVWRNILIQTCHEHRQNFLATAITVCGRVYLTV